MRLYFELEKMCFKTWKLIKLFREIDIFLDSIFKRKLDHYKDA